VHFRQAAHATIYFARTWDHAHNAWYQVFSGVITPAVDANWKQSRLEAELASFHPKVQSVDERKRELQAAGVPGLVQSATHDFMDVTIGRLAITFALEPNTKFLERVLLSPQPDATSSCTGTDRPRLFKLRSR